MCSPSLERWVMVDDSPDGVTANALADIFERGSVFADRWPTDVRLALDVPDPLANHLRASLSAGNHVVITGAAGDGKSHLAMRVLDDLNASSFHEVVRGRTLPSDLPPHSIVFLRDVSALTDDDVLAAVLHAQ